MGGLSNETIFYAGIVILVCGLAAAAVVLIFFRIKAKRLNRLFDEEYGERPKRYKA